MKFKVYQREITSSTKHEFITLTERSFNICHVMGVLGWRLIYEV